MTADTCPFCGAPMIRTSGTRIYWACGSWRLWSIEMQEGATYQGEQCARYVRTRISQLRRMARCADRRMDELLELDAEDNGFSQGFYWRWFGRFTSFRDACLRKIERLRGAP